MTLVRKTLARLLMGIALTWVGPLHAQTSVWSEYAFISSTLGVSDSRICIGEGSRGEIGCPTYAPTISPTGRINATAGLTVDSVSMTTTGTTWGYLGSGASYIPNLASNAVSATNISATTINGIAVSALGGGASPTNVPAFLVHRGGVDQAITASAYTKVLYTAKSFDTFNNFNTSTSRFTPTVAGRYIFHASGWCTGSSTRCSQNIYKNGNLVTRGSVTGAVASGFAILDMNGMTDYVENFVDSDSTPLSGVSNHTFFSGSLLASGNGMVSGTGATALSGLTDVTLASPATGQVLTYNGTSWVNATPSATTVISGTTSMVSGWPDAIVCNVTAPAGSLVGKKVLPLVAQTDSLTYYAEAYAYSSLNGNAPSDFVFNTVGKTFNQARGYTASDCHSKSITTLYDEGKAFNFIGNSGAGGGSAMGDRLTSGTLAVTANSTTAIVSLSTNGTTWGYLGSGTSYLPNLSSNAISATNISATTINGIAVSALGSGSNTVISGTTSMVSGWPDAIMCTRSDGIKLALYVNSQVSNGAMYYRPNESSAGSYYGIVYNSNGSFNSYETSGSSYPECAISISQLYAEGKAFNFIGNSGAGGSALGDRITSGTQSIIASQASGTIKVSGSLQPLNNTGGTCTADKVGAITVIDGRLHICRM